MFGLWLALGIFLACTTAGLGLAVVRALQAWRQLKRTRAVIGEELARISRVSAEIERQLAAASASQDRLRQSVDRLGRSRRQLAVQVAAVAEAQWVMHRLLPFLPR